jgi:hypothetical protein
MMLHLACLNVWMNETRSTRAGLLFFGKKEGQGMYAQAVF